MKGQSRASGSFRSETSASFTSMRPIIREMARRATSPCRHVITSHCSRRPAIDKARPSLDLWVGPVGRLSELMRVPAQAQAQQKPYRGILDSIETIGPIGPVSGA